MKISVGMCAHNEVKNIANLLESLLDQPLFPHQELLEIIVVCSGCTDGTDDVVRRFNEKDPRVKLVSQNIREGKSRAQNIILREAKGDVIVFISADTYPTYGSVAVLADAIKGKIGGADSRVLLLNEPRGLANLVSRFTWELHNNTMMHENDCGRLAHLAGDMFAVRRGIIDEIPSYVINDDAYMGMVVRLSGYRIHYVPQSVCYIWGPRTVKDYIAQRRRVLFGHRQLARVLGKPPTVLKTMFFQRPFEAMSIFFRVTRQSRLKELPKALAAVILEVAISMLAYWDSVLKRGEQHILWERISSTKMLVDVLGP